MTLTVRKIHAATVIAVALSACASTPPPRDDLDRARVALEQAAPARGYDEYVQAQGRLRQAEAAFAERKYALASELAFESELAAKLAEARARAATRRAEVEQRMADNAALRAELLGREGRR